METKYQISTVYEINHLKKNTKEHKKVKEIAMKSPPTSFLAVISLYEPLLSDHRRKTVSTFPRRNKTQSFPWGQ